ncbi:MAG TPA: hypothetical protein VMH77_03830, partial [Steroidobacteraceae bacterium]|nr:hypothetical protein [Steroidobacteraceae bacterium]
MGKGIVAGLLLIVAGCGGGSSSGGSGGTGTGGGGTTPASGLDSRPSNTTCLAGAAPSVSLALQPVFAGLGNFNEPIMMLQEPASAAHWYVVQHDGRVYVFDNQPDVTTKRLFIDLNAAISGESDGEMGLLGMAFHPGWPTDPRVYFSYTTYLGSQLVSQIVEYRTLDGGQTADLSTANVLLQVSQPETNHN